MKRAIITAVLSLIWSGSAWAHTSFWDGVVQVEEEKLSLKKKTALCKQLENMVRVHIREKQPNPKYLENQVYSPMVMSVVTPAGAHRLHYEGLTVPLPPVAASEKVVGADRFALEFDKRFGNWSFVWIRTNGDFISIGPMIGSEEPHGDLFASSGHHGKPSPARRAYSQGLFGKDPRLYDIMEHAYSIKPADYRCDPKKYMDGVRDAYALVIKKTATGGPGTVHRSPSRIPGILVIKQFKDNRFQANLALVHEGRYIDFSVVSRSRGALGPYLIWMHHIAKGKDGADMGSTPVVALPDMGARLMAFIQSPSPDAARTLLRYADMKHNRGIHRVSEALNAYLKQGK